MSVLLTCTTSSTAPRTVRSAARHVPNTAVAPELKRPTANHSRLRRQSSKCSLTAKGQNIREEPSFDTSDASRRGFLSAFGGLLAATTCRGDVAHAAPTLVEMPALQGRGYGKPTTIYPDYELTDSGLQFKDLRIGAGPSVGNGDKILIDWDAYTIGYYGRIVQAKNLAKGGAFEGNDEGFLRFTVGSTDEVIPGIQEGLQGMKVGGIRRLIISPGPLNYPTDTGFKKIGPVPNSFSGKRTLDFVVCNQGAIDKTLLFDIEILGVGDRARTRRAEGEWLVTVSP